MAGAVEGRQCFALAARPVPGEHQLAPGVFSQRIPGDECLQLADQVRVAAESEISVDPLLECGGAQVVQPSNLDAGEGCVSQILERRPPE